MPDEQGQGSEQGTVTILYTLHYIVDADRTGKPYGKSIMARALEKKKSHFGFLNYHWQLSMAFFIDDHLQIIQ